MGNRELLNCKLHSARVPGGCISIVSAKLAGACERNELQRRRCLLAVRVETQGCLKSIYRRTGVAVCSARMYATVLSMTLRHGQASHSAELRTHSLGAHR